MLKSEKLRIFCRLSNVRAGFIVIDVALFCICLLRKEGIRNDSLEITFAQVTAHIVDTWKQIEIEAKK